MKNDLYSKVQIYSLYYFRIRSRKQDFFEKPQINSNLPISTFSILENLVKTVQP